MKTLTSTIALATLGFGTVANAAGMDRATFNPSLLYTEGTRAELGFALTNPDVGTTAVGPRFTVAPKFNTVQLGYKRDLTDKFSLALMYNSNPFGVHIDYAAAPIPALAALNAKLDSDALIFLGKYQINERISAFGGVRYTEVSGSANIPPIPEGLNVDGSGTDFIIGASYEIPAIALRASLSYESGAELDPTVIGAASTTNYGIGQINQPEAITLNFETGVNEKTLAFANIRYAKWEDAQVVLPAALGGGAVSSFENSAAFNIGLARRITDDFVMSASLSYESSGTEPLSPLAPTNGIKGISVGGRYTSPNGLETSLGISYSKRGGGIVDTDSTGTISAGDLPFSGNKVITIGLKVAKSF